VNLWRIIKMQAALALFVAAAMTQVAHAATTPSQKALDAVGARWNAAAEAYNARPAASYYSADALAAMAGRSQAQAASEQYSAFRTDFPAPSSEPGPASTGYVVGGVLIQPGQSAAEATASVRPDDRAGIRSVDGVAVSAADALALNDATHAARPDDRAGLRGTGASNPVATSVDGSFDWSDAGVGALGAIGTCVLLAGCAVVAVSHRRRRPAVL
jgi:hypothetical protein